MYTSSGTTRMLPKIVCWSPLFVLEVSGDTTDLCSRAEGESSVNKIYRNKQLETVYGLPKGRCVVCNKSSYMENTTWLHAVQLLAPAIRQMPVITDHPDWWICLTYDGFKSNVNVLEALDVLYSHKIYVAKEEVGISHLDTSKNKQEVTREHKGSCYSCVVQG